jgi:hypothetical protein
MKDTIEVIGDTLGNLAKVLLPIILALMGWFGNEVFSNSKRIVAVEVTQQNRAEVIKDLREDLKEIVKLVRTGSPDIKAEIFELQKDVDDIRKAVLKQQVQ